MNNLPPVATKSRYSLVRRNEDKALEIKPEKKESLTVKVNKYKSVRIIDVKSSLDREKQPPKQLNNADYTHMYDQKAIKININNPYNQKVFKTQYTYVKSKGTIMYTPHRLLTQYSYIKNKDMAKKLHTNKQTPSNMSMPIRNTSSSKIRKLKVKCNIPCRLFRKYGKCLRNVKGHCKYLHDKKHVSICRKFLKGVCHDKDCLLSHELSDKKMPTCFFYLQGMCTKDKCPYLHVKVNEKAIVCPDFKKGYCEKGNKCLYRHVETKKRGGIKILVNPKTKSTYQLKIFSDKSKTQNISEHKCVPSVGEDQTTISDCRYYKEVIVEDKTNELQQVIKPTRCKLGTLPSFIKF
nr:uncharacterized protein LOC128672869 [Plodia interpunctella]